MQDLLSRLLPLAVLTLLSACAQQPIAPEDSLWQEHQASLKALSHWDFDGKIALKTEQRAETASLSWSQTELQSTLVISGPMGWNQLSLISDSSGITLLKDGAVQRMEGPQAVAELTGWPLPTQPLQYWLKGLPDPNLPIDAWQLQDGRLAGLTQDQWTLEFERYQQEGQLVLPARIRFSHPRVSGKILIKQWRLSP